MNDKNWKCSSCMSTADIGSDGLCKKCFQCRRNEPVIDKQDIRQREENMRVDIGASPAYFNEEANMKKVPSTPIVFIHSNMNTTASSCFHDNDVQYGMNPESLVSIEIPADRESKSNYKKHVTDIGIRKSISLTDLQTDHKQTRKNMRSGNSLDTLTSTTTTTTTTSGEKFRCGICRKRIKLSEVITCRCKGVYCGLHRCPQEHSCTVDYHEIGREEIRKGNPKIVGKKIQLL